MDRLVSVYIGRAVIEACAEKQHAGASRPRLLQQKQEMPVLSLTLPYVCSMATVLLKTSVHR